MSFYWIGLTVRDKENPDGDIDIEVTGLRPGEKLYEELLIGENPQTTSHPRIMTSKEVMLSWTELQKLLSALELACKTFDPEKIREILVTAPTGFVPADEICDILKI